MIVVVNQKNDKNSNVGSKKEHKCMAYWD